MSIRARVAVAALALGIVAAAWAADRADTRRLPLGVQRSDVFSRVDTERPMIALSFDDGPHDLVTPAVLALLAETQARATFFVIGRNVEARPELLGRMTAAGHEVANHTWSHRVLTIITPAEAVAEISRGARAIEEAAGTRPELMRPPQGSTTDAVVQAARTLGQRVVLWSVALDEGSIRDRSLDAEAARVRPGDILLAHDVCPTPSREECAQLLPRAIGRLRAFLQAVTARGLRVVTVSDLIAAASP